MDQKNLGPQKVVGQKEVGFKKMLGQRKYWPQKIVFPQSLVKIRQALAEISYYTETRTDVAGTNAMLPGQMSPRELTTNTDVLTDQPSKFG